MSKLLNRASVLLLLLLGVYPQVYLIAETLHCHVELRLALWLLPLCLFLWLAACFRRGLLLGMPLSALTLLAAYRSLGGNPAAQLVDLFDRVTGVYYERFYAPGRSYVFTDAVPSHSLVLLLLGFLLAAYLAAALSCRSGRVPITLLGALPLPLLCLSVNGEPSALCMLALLLFVLLLIVGGSSYTERGGDGAAVFSALLPVTILLCALLLIYDPAKYHYDERDVETSRRFDLLSRLVSDWVQEKSADLESYMPQSLAQDFPLPETEDETRDESLPTPSPEAEPQETELPMSGWGELGAPMELSARYDSDSLQERVLTLRAERPGLLYLRMFSYGDYRETGWDVCTDEAPLSSLSLAASAVAAAPEARAQRVTLSVEQACPYAFLPYYSTAASPVDSYAPAAGASYTLDFVQYSGDLLSLTLSGEAAQREARYRDYAHAVYTRLPQETAESVRALCEEAGLFAEDPALIRQVAQYVQSRADYDIMTEPYPGQDCALYFLTEAESGYCIHFASAAAVVFRALGVPARVTVGYLAEVPTGLVCTVTEADAHAWVEVYRDGLGWVPVEVTGQQGSDSAESTVETAPSEGSEAVSTPAESESAAAAEAGTPATPAPLPVGPITGDESEPESEAEVRRPFPWGAVFGVLCALLLLASPFVWYRLARRRFLRALEQTDRRRSAVAVYRASARLARFGERVPKEVETCAEKASFSRHPIAQAELDASRAALEAQIAALCLRLKPWDKLLLKYGFGFM